MKSILAMVCCVMCFLSCKHTPTPPPILSIEISPAKDTAFVLRNNFWEPMDTLALLKGRFRDTLHLKDGFYYLSTGRSDLWLYVQQGADIQLAFDPQNVLESATFTGSLRNENKYLLLKAKLTQNIPIEQRAYSEYAKLNEKNFIAQTASLREKFHHQLSNTPQLDPQFIYLAKQTIDIDFALRLAQYTAMKRMIEQNPDFTVSTSYPDPFEKIDLNNPELLQTYRYTELLQQYISQEISSKEGADPQQDFFIQYQQTLATADLDPRIKDRLGYENHAVGFTYTKDLDSYYATYMGYVSSAKYKQKFQTAYAALRMEKGQPSPNFTVIDATNVSHVLDDYLGKYIYIDLWASWCTPCIAQLPHLKKLEEKYADKVTFISIAWNDTLDDWKRMLKTQNLTGHQLFAEDKDANFFTFYQVSSIPRFILLDPEGLILESKARQPSDPNLTVQFDQLPDLVTRK